jgi:hypothetical protein
MHDFHEGLTKMGVKSSKGITLLKQSDCETELGMRLWQFDMLQDAARRLRAD